MLLDSNCPFRKWHFSLLPGATKPDQKNSAKTGKMFSIMAPGSRSTIPNKSFWCIFKNVRPKQITETTFFGQNNNSIFFLRCCQVGTYNMEINVGSQFSDFFKSPETFEYMVVHQLNTGTIIRNVKKPKIRGCSNVWIGLGELVGAQL